MDVEKPRLSHEHKELGLFAAAEIEDLVMPEPYKRTIAAWYGRRRAAG